MIGGADSNMCLLILIEFLAAIGDAAEKSSDRRDKVYLLPNSLMPRSGPSSSGKSVLSLLESRL